MAIEHSNYNPFSLVSKHILVVGKTTGLEKAIIKQLELLGAEIMAIEIEDVDSIESIINESVRQDTLFDGFVFSKTASDFRPLTMTKHSIMEKVMNDNFFVFIDVLRILIKAKAIKTGASIVAMSSISSIRSMKAKTAFASSKAALDAAVRCLASELAEKGIRINTIQKGAVDADMEKSHIQSITALNEGKELSRQPLGITKAEEIGNTVAFLLSDATHTITGSTIVIDGGYTA